MAFLIWGGLMSEQNHNIEDCHFKDKIEQLSELTKENKHKIDKLMTGDWYSNKDLFKMIQELQINISALNDSFKKYFENKKEDRELIEKLDGKYSDIEKEINNIKKEKEVKEETTTNWREWIAWIITILLAIDKLGVF